MKGFEKSLMTLNQKNINWQRFCDEDLKLLKYGTI